MAKKKKKNRQPAKKRDRGTKIELGLNMIKKNTLIEYKNKFLDGLNKEYEFEFKNFENKINNSYIEQIKKNNFNLYKINHRKKQITEIYTKLFMPSDTLKFLPDELYENEKIENLLLKINKFPYFKLETKDKLGNRDKIKAVYYDKYCFDKEKETVRKIDYYNRIKKSLFKTDELKLKINDKLIIGLGSPSIYETSITLHHIYGVPYILGSAIKGSFRNYIIETYFNKNEEKALKEKWFVDIFGNEEEQGKVIFFDAFSNDVEIEKDIMNNHYPNYYDGNEYPTDDQNPRPINFLGVRGTFKFIFGVKKDFEIKINKNRYSVLKFIKENLEKSLKEFGIGAKTAVGYGYFEEVKND